MNGKHFRETGTSDTAVGKQASMPRMTEESPNRTGVVVVEELKRTEDEIRYRFKDTGPVGGEVTGYVVRFDDNDNSSVWRPYIRSTTNSGYWSAGDTLVHMKGYSDPYSAFDALLKEAGMVLGGDPVE